MATSIEKEVKTLKQNGETKMNKEITFGEFKQNIVEGLETIGEPLYIHKPYEIKNKEGYHMAAGTLEMLLRDFIINCEGGYDHCIIQVRKTDSYANDNTRVA